MGPFIPRLVSAFSGSYGHSRLQKLAFRTLPLQAGELSALLNLTPDLVELDINVPPAADILRLTYSEGRVMLVPKLQALYLHSPVLPMSTQVEHFHSLAQVRFKLDTNREDATKPYYRTWTRLRTLRFVFDPAGSRDCSEKVLNNRCQSFTPEEIKAIDMLSRCGDYIRDYSLKFETNTTAHLKVMFDELLDCTEHYKVTINVLHDTNIHIALRHYFRVGLMNLPDQDEKYKMERKVKHILAKWDQLLLTDLCDYRWVRTSHDYSLAYLPKGDFHALMIAPDAGLRRIVYGLKLQGRFKEVLWNRYLPPPCFWVNHISHVFDSFDCL